MSRTSASTTASPFRMCSSLLGLLPCITTLAPSMCRLALMKRWAALSIWLSRAYPSLMKQPSLSSWKLSKQVPQRLSHIKVALLPISSMRCNFPHCSTRLSLSRDAVYRAIRRRPLSCMRIWKLKMPVNTSLRSMRMSPTKVSRSISATQRTGSCHLKRRTWQRLSRRSWTASSLVVPVNLPSANWTCSHKAALVKSWNGTPSFRRPSAVACTMSFMIRRLRGHVRQKLWKAGTDRSPTKISTRSPTS